MKKYLLVLVALLGLVLVGCKKEEDDNGDGNGNGNGNGNVVEITKYEGFLDADNIYITTIGQADLPIAENLLAGSGLVVKQHNDDDVSEANVVSNNLLKASDVEDQAIVILVIGASGKGLGDAGTNLDAELVRADEFIAKAKADKIKLVVFHLGGSGRTGQTSDPIINKTIPAAKFSVVLNAAKNEKFMEIFVNAAKDKSDLFEFSAVAELIEGLKVLVP